MERICAWTGNPFTGKGYLIKTTEGEEIVSPAALAVMAVPGFDTDPMEHAVALAFGDTPETPCSWCGRSPSDPPPAYVFTSDPVGADPVSSGDQSARVLGGVLEAAPASVVEEIGKTREPDADVVSGARVGRRALKGGGKS